MKKKTKISHYCIRKKSKWSGIVKVLLDKMLLQSSFNISLIVTECSDNKLLKFCDAPKNSAMANLAQRARVCFRYRAVDLPVNNTLRLTYYFDDPMSHRECVSQSICRVSAKPITPGGPNSWFFPLFSSTKKLAMCWAQW